MDAEEISTLAMNIDKTRSMVPFEDPYTSTKDHNAIYHSVQIATIYQPFHGEGDQPLFMQHFISAFFHPRSHPGCSNIWIYELPSFISVAPSTALICSIRAATMAHYGKQTGDLAMQFEACRWYDRGLESQRLRMSRRRFNLPMGAT